MGASAGLVGAFMPSTAAGASQVTSQSSPVKVAIGHALAVPPAARDLGPQDVTAPLNLDVSLSPRDPAALQSFLSEVYDPSSPMYHHFLAPGQFGPTFGAAPATIAAVESTLSSLGLHPGPVNPDDVTIPVATTVGAAERAFGVSLHSYRLASGRVAFSNTSAPLLPASVAGSVVSIVGLSNLHQLLPQTATPTSAAPKVAPRVTAQNETGPTGCTSAQNAGGYTGNQLATAYGFSTGAYSHGMLGQGETIALYELEPYAPSDVNAFETCYGINTTVNEISVDGGAGTGPGTGESILDIDNVIEMAPDATVDVYEAPNGGAGPYDEYAQIANNDTAEVISTSWGICEADAGDAQAEETVFEQMATQGQSLLDAAGDAGSEDCYSGTGTPTTLAVDDPASDPYVTGVGGNTLLLNANNAVSSQTVWNDGVASGDGAGGGGISTLWPKPTWQTGNGVINGYSTGKLCGAATGYCREVPDVSAVADPNDGYSIYDAGNWTSEGGTSGAAPLWAALTALADESCGATKPAQAAGLLNPALYLHPSDLYDITSGNNDYTGTNKGAYPATTGYDMASGLGAPTAALFAPGVLCVNHNTAATSVSATTVSTSNRQAGAGGSTWTYNFTTSTNGDLTNGAGTITLAAPSGTVFPSTASDYTVNDTTAATVAVGNPANTVTVTVPAAIGGSSAVSVVASGVTNPAAGADPASDFTVATSADTTSTPAAAGLSFGSGVTGVTAGVTSYVAGGMAMWTYQFTTSQYGGLGAGDTITLAAPSGTVFPSQASDYTVNGASAHVVAVQGGNTVAVDTPIVLPGGSQVSLVVSGIVNPALGADPSSDFSVSTAADVTAVNPTAGLTFVAAPAAGGGGSPTGVTTPAPTAPTPTP
ncbi:MAG: protease pro-enzyme activation domain-containing protein, partial [Acidimicrobiales bacterium]